MQVKCKKCEKEFKVSKDTYGVVKCSECKTLNFIK